MSNMNQLAGALSPVNHKRLHQGWAQTSIHLLLLIPYKSHGTAKFFKVHIISLDTNTKHANIKHKFSKKESSILPTKSGIHLKGTSLLNTCFVQKCRGDQS